MQNAENDIKTAENAATELHSSENGGTISRDVATLDSYGVSDEGKRAFLQYKSSGSYKINAKLRDGLELSEADIQLVRGMDETLEKLPIYSGKTYREIVFDHDDKFEAFLSTVKAGDSTSFPAYTSSSKTDGAYSIKGGKHIVKMELVSKTARDASNMGVTAEEEIIFPRNAKFFVESISQTGNITKIKAWEVVSNGSQGRGSGKESIHNEPGVRVPAV